MNASKAATVLAAVVMAVVSVLGQQTENGKVLERSVYVFPDFEKVAGPKTPFSKQEYTAAVNGPFEMERLVYSSDGLKVSALLYRPKSTPAAKLPVIVFNRGGYIRGDIAPEVVTAFGRLAREGFIIVAPLYRGSDGGEGKDEVGGADVADLMNVVPVVRSLENADADNIFLYGESRGGMMVLQAVRDGFPANAAATYGAFSDFEALVKTDPKLYDPLIKVLWPDYEIRKREIADRRSAIKWADRLNVPLLLMQGGSDRSVDPMQTLKFAERLQELGKPYELLVFAGDNHTLLRHQAERDWRAAAWFKAHIRK